MEPNAFIGKREQPTNSELEAAIGAAALTQWNQILGDLENGGLINTSEWNSYSPKAGWSRRLKLKKRTILYMIPYEAGFRVAFIFGGKALTVIRETKFPARVLKALDEAKKYPEGTGIWMDIKKPADVGIVTKLAAIKVAN